VAGRHLWGQDARVEGGLLQDERQRVLPYVGCYEERYRLTGRVAPPLAAGLPGFGVSSGEPSQNAADNGGGPGPGRSGMIHAPRPSAAARSLNRAVGMTRPYASAVALHGNGFIAAFTGGLAFARAASR
jgi:hypothetical protein